jgi:hypothetical protein
MDNQAWTIRRVGTRFASYRRKADGCPVSGQEVSLSDALVPLAPTHRAVTDIWVTSRPHADFVAHLIATAVQAPQTCARRRAALEDAIAAYDALDCRPTVPGRALSRSL